MRLLFSVLGEDTFSTVRVIPIYSFSVQSSFLLIFKKNNGVVTIKSVTGNIRRMQSDTKQFNAILTTLLERRFVIDFSDNFRLDGTNKLKSMQIVLYEKATN